MSSNIPDHTQTRCFVTEGDPSDVVRKLVAHLHDLSRVADALLSEKFKAVFDQLKDMVLQANDDDADTDEDECFNYVVFNRLFYNITCCFVCKKKKVFLFRVKCLVHSQV